MSGEEHPPRVGVTGEGSEALAGFLREVRSGVEAGADPMTAAEGASTSLPTVLQEAIDIILRRLRGDYSEDEWGFDEDFAEAVFPLFRFLYDVWWRVDVTGVRNVPAHGRGLLVANHAGSLFPFDAWRRLLAAESRLRGHAPGTYGSPAGLPRLRAASSR